MELWQRVLFEVGILAWCVFLALEFTRMPDPPNKFWSFIQILAGGPILWCLIVYWLLADAWEQSDD